LAGAPEKAQRLEEQGLDILQRLGDQHGLAWTNHDLGEIAFVRGDLDRAQRFLEQSCHRFDDLDLTYGSYRASSMLADVHRLKAEWVLALTGYERSLALQPQTPTGGAEILEGLAQIAAALQQPALAARLFGCGHAWRQTYGLGRFYFYEVEHSRSLTSAQQQISPDEWHANYTAGWRLRPEQAVEEARRAGTELTEIAAMRAASGLTRRQQEIVRLVAEGFSNADIAGRLVVSHRTVDAHLRSIFDKLGVTTRTAAVHEAMRRHLI
jgi:DNA-binding CsgD family transcriptional regulator